MKYNDFSDKPTHTRETGAGKGNQKTFKVGLRLHYFGQILNSFCPSLRLLIVISDEQICSVALDGQYRIQIKRKMQFLLFSFKN